MALNLNNPSLPTPGTAPEALMQPTEYPSANPTATPGNSGNSGISAPSTPPDDAPSHADEPLVVNTPPSSPTPEPSAPEISAPSEPPGISVPSGNSGTPAPSSPETDQSAQPSPWLQQFQPPQTRGDELWLRYSQLLGNPEQEEKQQRAHQQRLGILAIADAMRHMGNIYHTTKYAPSQKFNDPVTEAHNRYIKENTLLAEQRAKAADRLQRHIKLVEDAKYAALKEARDAQRLEMEKEKADRDSKYNDARIESMKKRDEIAQQNADRQAKAQDELAEYRKEQIALGRERNRIAASRGSGRGGGGRGGGGRRRVYVGKGSGSSGKSGNSGNSGFQDIVGKNQSAGGSNTNVSLSRNDLLGLADMTPANAPRRGTPGKRGLPDIYAWSRKRGGIKTARPGTYQDGDLYIWRNKQGNDVYWSPKRKEYYAEIPGATLDDYKEEPLFYYDDIIGLADQTPDVPEDDDFEFEDATFE